MAYRSDAKQQSHRSYTWTQTPRFQKFIIKLRKQHCYDLSLIGNADQTPLNFDNPYNRTLEVKGAKTVSIATTGHEKSRFTIMLACMANGTKLPPYIVFKRKTMPKNVIFPNTVHVRVHPKGWIDEALMLACLQMVWAKRPAGLMRKRSLIVLDAFRCHRMPSVKKRLHQDKTDWAIIPGGMTKMLQPLDVTVNKPMKDALCRKWNTWLLEGEHTFTAGGRTRTPMLQDVAQWIADVWVELDPAIIRKEFLKCSISNAMDGSKDDALWMDPSDDESSEGELPVCEDDNDLYYLDEDVKGYTPEDIACLFEEDSNQRKFEGFKDE